MEQKRTLWILLATGFFLLVVLGSAMILCGKSANKCTNGNTLREDGIIWTTPSSSHLSNSSATTPDSVETSEEPVADITENVFPVESQTFENSVVSELSIPEEGKTELAEDNSKNLTGTIQTNGLTVISNGTTNIYGYAASPDGTTTIDLNSSYTEQESSVTAKNQAAEKAIQETIAVKNYETNSAVISETPKVQETKPVVKAESKPVVSASASTSKVTATKPASTSGKTSTVSKNTTSAKTTTAKTSTAASSASTTKVPDRFWVQAASFTSKKAADEARTVLDENKIQCEVFTYTDAKGTLYYRVRVGPYTTKTEAEYWKTKIDVIPMFKNNKSYVTNSSAAAK